MTFVPSPKLDKLSATYSERILTSSTALASAGSSTSNIIISSTRPVNVTTRFEAFSCKKVASNKHAAAVQPVPSFNQNPNNNSLNPLALEDEDSQGAEEERDLLAASSGSYSFSASDQQQNNSSSKVSDSSTGKNQQHQQLVVSDIDRMVAVTSAVMDAKYALDGYGFEGELKTRHISLLEPEVWLKLVSSLTVHATPSSTSAILGTNSSSSSLIKQSPGATNPSATSSGGGSSSSSSFGFSGFTSGASSNKTNSAQSSDVKALWKDISDILVGTNEEISSNVPSSGGGVNTVGGLDAAAHQMLEGMFPSPSHQKGPATAGASLPSLNASPREKHAPVASEQKIKSPLTPTSSSSSSLALTHPGLIFLRLDAPDLDPQRKLGGLSLRSQSATPLTTPITINPVIAGQSGAKVQFPSSSKANLAGAFPTAPTTASSSGSRRDRDGFAVVIENNDNNNDNDGDVGEGLNSIPQSPTSFTPGGVEREKDVTLSEHLFVYHKKTKMCVAVMTCGK